MAKLKNEGKKLKGSDDKTDSEYEMLLNEKDAQIAEYLLGSYKQHSREKVCGNFVPFSTSK